MRVGISWFSIITLAGLLYAGQFWNDKEPAQWTDQEARTMLTKSPWAKEVTMSFNRERMGGPGMGGPGMGGGMGGPGIGGPGMSGGGMPRGGDMDSGGAMRGGGMGGPGMGRPGMEGGPPDMKVTLRWESAEPVREAAGKAESAIPQVAEWTRDFYVITASGMPMPGRRPRPEDGQQQSRDPGPMMQRLKDATSLKTKRTGAVHAERVEFVERRGERVVAFLFPRSETLSPNDKEVTFESAMGPMQMKARFTLKDMVFKGALSL